MGSGPGWAEIAASLRLLRPGAHGPRLQPVRGRLAGRVRPPPAAGRRGRRRRLTCCSSARRRPRGWPRPSRAPATGAARVVVVEGAAGLGKTRLLRQARSLATGLTVLSASGSELEHEFGFGVVRQLLERADGVGASTPPAGGERFATLHALYWLVAGLADERPLLLLVDDAQWADEPSLRFLAFLARRVAGARRRAGDRRAPAAAGEDRTILEAIAAEAETLAPAPLERGRDRHARRRFGDDAALRRSIRGRRRATRCSSRRCWPRSRPSSASRGRRACERIGRRVARRLAALGDAAGRWPPPSRCSATAPSLELAAAARRARARRGARDAAAELVAADLFEDAGTLRFRHPLIRAAVAERLPAVELGEAHARAARLLAERGAPPGVVAAHLLAAPPAGDAWVAEALREAARDARAQGAPELAATYLRRALAEPPRRSGRRSCSSSGAPSTRPASTEAPGAARGGLAARRATPRSRSSSASMLGEQHPLARGGGGRARGARRTRRRLARPSCTCSRCSPTSCGWTRRSAATSPSGCSALAATLEGETPGERHVLAAAAVITPVDTAAEHARAAELTQRTQADVDRFSDTGVVSNFIRAGRLEQAEEAAEEALATARARRVHPAPRVDPRTARVDLARARGRCPRRATISRPRWRSAPTSRCPPPVHASNAAMLALVLAEQGESGACGRAARAPRPRRRAPRAPGDEPHPALPQPRARAAGPHGRGARGRARDGPPLRAARPPPRGAALALARRGADRRRGAGARGARAGASAGARRSRAGSRSRGLGLVTQDEALLRRAVEELEPAPNRLELARARVELGALLRRSGRRADAREPLRRGHGRRARLRRQAARRARPHRAAGHRRATEKARSPGHRRAHAERAPRHRARRAAA